MRRLRGVICWLRGHKWTGYKASLEKISPSEHLNWVHRMWLFELEEELRKDGIPEGVYPVARRQCERCGKSDYWIDSLYEATKADYLKEG